MAPGSGEGQIDEEFLEEEDVDDVENNAADDDIDFLHPDSSYYYPRR